MGLLAANNGWSRQGIVEQVRVGSIVCYLLPEFQSVQASSMGRRAAQEKITATDNTSNDLIVSSEPRANLTSAEKLAVSTLSSGEVAPEMFGVEAKHFTDIRVLNRHVSHL